MKRFFDLLVVIVGIYVVVMSTIEYFEFDVEMTTGFAWISSGVLILGNVIVSIYCFLKKGWLFKVLGIVFVANLLFIIRQFAEAMV